MDKIKDNKTTDKKEKKDTKRDRCKTCNSGYREEIEKMYLEEGKSAPYVSKYLMDTYGFSITAAGVLNHFKICLDKQAKKVEADKRTEEMLQEVLKRKIEVVDIISKMINLLFEINMIIHSKVYKAGKVSGRTESDSIRNYTGEMREYIKLYKDLTEDSGKGKNLNEAEVIANYENVRRRNAEILQKAGSFEIKGEAEDIGDIEESEE